METLLFDARWIEVLSGPVGDTVFALFGMMVQAPAVLALLALGLWLWSGPPMDRTIALLVLVTSLQSIEGDLLPLVAGSTMSHPPAVWVPSEAAGLAAALWVWLAWEGRRWWLSLLAFVMVTGTALMRLYFGLSTPVSVLTGLSQGVALAMLLGFALGPNAERWVHVSRPVLAAVTLVGFALAWGVWMNWPNSPAPLASSSFLAMGAGWWVGRVLDEGTAGRWQAPTKAWQKIALGLTGMALIYAFRAGLTAAAIALKLPLLAGLLGIGFLTGLAIAGAIPALARGVLPSGPRRPAPEPRPQA